MPDVYKRQDYSFADLYCSTLNQEELNIGARYNKNAVKFQYDFLNDDVEEFESIKTELKRPLMYKSGVNMDAMEQYINFAQILDLYCMAIEKGFMTQEDGQMAYSRAINILHGTKSVSYTHLISIFMSAMCRFRRNLPLMRRPSRC